METEIIIAQDNRLTMSRYDFTPIEKRCLYYVIKEVRRLYVDRDLRENETAYKDLFSDMYLKLEPAHLQQLGDEVKDVYNALRRLREKEILIDTDQVWIAVSWIIKAKHDKRKDIYEVQVSNEILPYLVELAQQFTEYNLTVAISLKSTYSQRMYEMCCQYKNKGRFFIEVDKLRYILKIENLKTYDNTANIKRKILDVAQKELKHLFDTGQCDLFFTYREKDKEKRKVLSYWFELHTKETEEQKRINYEDIQAQINRIIEICRSFIKNDDRYIQRIQNALILNPDIVISILDKLNKKVLDYPRKEIAPIIRFVLKEDFGIK